MNENDNNFDALRRLLVLKRHEIPPPGYFENFSGNVIARIRAGEAAQPMPWFMRFFQAFEAKPAYPVALASSLCVLLLFGIVSVEQNPELAPIWGSAPNSSMADANPGLIAFAGNTNSPMDISANPSLFGSQSSSLSRPESFPAGN